MFRPGFIVPLHGIQSRTRMYRVFYSGLKPILPMLHRFFPRSILTTEELGRAMLIAARQAPAKRVLETGDLRDLLS